ncbi:MAG: YeeE/YedE family protein, partial [Anaerolineae bacterium]|nr:YeeE/YedE family protein [Anaerolineae bacterium]
DPWIPPFAWGANIFGGLIFGVGMVVASSCVTGLFFKLGHGMLGTLVGLAAWAAGDILVYRGPLSGLRESLTASQTTLTLDGFFGSMGWVVVLVLGLLAAYWLFRAPKEMRHNRGKLWGWLPLGIAVGLIISVSWLLADVSNVNYPFGTSYVPTQIYLSITTGEKSSLWIPITLISIILGAFIAAKRADTLWFRGETLHRYLQLSAGGFLMGVGAAFAGGCNLGHALVGVPLLSLGSIATVLAMMVGVYIPHQMIVIWKRNSI